MSEQKSLSVHEPQAKLPSPFSGEVSSFEGAQRMSRALAESDIVPANFKGKVANCLVALELAQRTGSSVLAVMQSLYVVQGKPTWSAQYIIASINASGKFSPLRFERSTGEPVKLGSGKVTNHICTAVATDLKTGEVLRGPSVSVEMASAEGWLNKSGSKWQTMPELMVQYRAGTFFGRLFCPEILLGMSATDEIRDVSPPEVGRESASQPAAQINERIRARRSKVPTSDPAGDIDLSAVPITEPEVERWAPPSGEDESLKRDAAEGHS